MDQQLKDFYNNHKILFFLALPIILILVFNKAIIAILTGSAKAELEKAKAKDSELSKDSSEASLEAAKEQQKADDLQNKIDSGKEQDINPDWNLKK